MNNIQKKVIFSIIGVLMLVVIVLAVTYAVFAYSKTGNTESKVIAGILKFNYIENTGVGAGISLTNAFPVSDDVGKKYQNDGEIFDFSIEATNTGSEVIPYEVTLRKQKSSTLAANVVKVYLTDISNNTEVELLEPTLYTDLVQTGVDVGSETEKTIYNGNVSGNTNKYLKKIRLRMWVDEKTDFSGIEQPDGTMVYPYNDKSFTATVNVYANVDSIYKDSVLNGADPILEAGSVNTTTSKLVPIIIDDTGKVTKADIYKKWYSYSDKKWANAVILKDESVVYENGETIPESNIESYFVWVPKYSYKIWDLGNYTNLTAISKKEQVIDIKFGLTDTNDSVGGECTTPGVAGEIGKCQVGDYMTHPAFISFSSNGFWVGKFETGYDGAITTVGAQSDTVDISKIVIKPNTYSWRNITLGNMFKNSFDYNRDLDSHMIKNTEWGAVAYLQHTKYGSATSVRINNNSSYITGYAAIEEPIKGHNENENQLGTSIEGNRNESTSLGVDGIYTINYLNSTSTVASTTGNYTGIYDMSGGAWEMVMGYTTGASTVGGDSNITSLYSNFFSDTTYTKYWDKYTSTLETDYNNRILGDATGEMGSFGSQTDPDGKSRKKSSWYGDYSFFINSSLPWFARSGNFSNGTSAGIFTFHRSQGLNQNRIDISYRIVLTPTK